ncbi:related to TFIIIC subunit, 55 kDa (transcription initiation factor) [Melanopsichium pennsylvanicum]|uniref:Related to TFIIIC subunit, 55 kDa (Transcription initiation factor) n=2 Tax=Melanopsichium pennsylvanicum TaxID=63383 RepID=A0AAJ4XJS5_9BASI|nr:related to TFIIIC subunit, 55 kDa (transcription initiation factor) [Melanopsichium pennsylvanicum 4]SNX83780.1 related to TFIIIC subunit, 55 kDa (transcription initiation factor) [Melanopsichium pennsylvanicum]
MLETIFICRHGFRMSWIGSEYFPTTNRPRDPILTAHGQSQARHLASYLSSLPSSEQPQLIVSSPYYRCLQTSLPTAAALKLELVAEPGLAEWFPTAVPNTGIHPSPARMEYMSNYLPELSLSWKPLLVPNNNGETISELHARAKQVLEFIEQRCEQLGVTRVLLCSHAATIIAMGRVLQGDAETRQKFVGAGTASLSKYTRLDKHGKKGWKQELNGDASFLPGGVEREWTFDMVPDNVTEHGMGLGWADPHAPTVEQEVSNQGQNRTQTKL